MTYADTPSATSSPGSAGGRSPCNLQDGQQTDPSGLAAALASLSPRLAKTMGLLTSGTSGLPSTGSSNSADLQSWLANRLPVQLSDLGSTLYSLTWKPWVTPAGRTLVRQRASVRRTSVTDRTGWPTPTAALADKGVRTFEGGLLEAMRNHGPDLAAAACLVGWPTPVARDHFPAHTPEYIAAKKAQGHGMSNLNDLAQLAGWPTTSCSNDRTGNPESALQMTRKDGSKVQQRLQDFAVICQPIRYTASGKVLIGSDAEMESGGQLNPAHSRWLQGYPESWCEAAIRAHCSTLKRRRKPV